MGPRTARCMLNSGITTGKFVIVCALFVFVCGTRALAAAEFCPAIVGALHPIDGTTVASLYAFALDAQGPRSVRATIAIETNAGWFTANVGQTELTKRTYQIDDGYARFSRDAYESAAQFVRFPQPVAIREAFVLNAQTSGDETFGWDAKGDVTCQAPPRFEQFSPSVTARIVRVANPRTDLDSQPTPGTPMLVAKPASVPGRTDCQNPFVAVGVVKAAPPAFPPGYGVTGTFVTLIAVAINSNGTVNDAWVYAPSGAALLDAAALKAAQRSTYHGGTSFCEPAPGTYLFRAEFRP
jgi:hypothetical protein